MNIKTCIIKQMPSENYKQIFQIKPNLIHSLRSHYLFTLIVLPLMLMFYE